MDTVLVHSIYMHELCSMKTETTNYIVGFKVPTAVVMKSTRIFWNITPCSPLKVYRHFGGTYRNHLQGRRISRARNHRETVGYLLLRRFLARLIPQP
jgi:hypothetical protein